MPAIKAAFINSGETRIVDLCSGGGGPTLAIARALRAASVDAPLVLTDLYPNKAAFAYAKAQANIDSVATPVDATQVPKEHDGFRTMFNAFHHLEPALAKAVLQDAVNANKPIVIAEVVERHPAQFIGLLFSPLFFVLLLPLLRPFRWSWLLWTLIPVLPLFVMWDGLVSCLRIYSPAELHALAATLDNPNGYSFRVERVRLGMAPVKATLFIGSPALNAAKG